MSEGHAATGPDAASRTATLGSSRELPGSLSTLAVLALIVNLLDLLALLAWWCDE
jgi:hypothetical protein